MHADAVRLVYQWLPGRDRVLAMDGSPALRDGLLACDDWRFECLPDLPDDVFGRIAPHITRCILSDRAVVELSRSAQLLRLTQLTRVRIATAEPEFIRLLPAMPWLRELSIVRMANVPLIWSMDPVDLPSKLGAIDVPERFFGLVKTAPGLTRITIAAYNCHDNIASIIATRIPSVRYVRVVDVPPKFVLMLVCYPTVDVVDVSCTQQTLLAKLIVAAKTQAIVRCNTVMDLTVRKPTRAVHIMAADSAMFAYTLEDETVPVEISDVDDDRLLPEQRLDPHVSDHHTFT